MTRSLLGAAAVALLLSSPAAAQAAEPTMALADVQPGMRCTAASVVQGTQVSTFDAEVLDVLRSERLVNARILVRVWGPAIAATGVGPGFSGSPITCPDAQGTPRVVGAISEGIGDYGGDVLLATPIESILAEPVAPPAPAAARAARADAVPPAVRRRFPTARPLATPLSLSGLSEPVARALTQAARRAGRPLLAVPGRARAAQAAVPLVPGAAIAAGLASGDLGLGAIGTLTYVDGDRFWAFGHPLEAVGRRSLFLQDAYVHAVVANPLGVPGLETYKLASPGADRGTVSGDGLSAVAGTIGALPPSFPLAVSAVDTDTGARTALATRVADEGDVGQPAGYSPLGIVATAAVAEAAFTAQRAAPARQGAEMCLRVRLRELEEPLRICNRYVVDSYPQALIGALVGDVVGAVGVLDAYRFATLHPEDVRVDLRARRGLPLAVMERGSAPGRVRPGRTARVRVRVRQARTGERSTVTVPVRIPRDVRPGRRALVLAGPGPDDGAELFGLALLLEGSEREEEEPSNLRELRRAFERLERYDGVRGRLAGRRFRAYRDEDRRLSGRIRVPLTIAKR
jgi:hypothetical protein